MIWWLRISKKTDLIPILLLSIFCWSIFYIFHTRFLAFTGRIILAVLDHNIHVFRPFAFTKAGKQRYDRKYSKRTKKWHVQPVKAPKEYNYWPHLMSRALKLRSEDKESVYQDPLMTPKNWHKQLQWSNQRQLLNSYSLGRRGLAIPNLEMCFVFVSFKIPVIIEMLFSYDKPLHCIHSVQ